MALIVATAGGAYAASAGAPTITACVHHNGGGLYVARHCAGHDRRLTWNVQGPRGTAGVTGQPGQRGPAGPDTGTAGGDLSGNYPSPTIAPEPAPTNVGDNPETTTDPCSGSAPQTAIFCGTATASGFWLAGDYAGNGVQFWRDRLGEVHIRGDARASKPSLSDELFVLPPSDRPAVLQSFPILTSIGAGAFAGTGHPALLVIEPSGTVSVEWGNSTDVEVLIGEAQFRTDA